MSFSHAAKTPFYQNSTPKISANACGKKARSSTHRRNDFVIHDFAEQKLFHSLRATRYFSHLTFALFTCLLVYSSLSRRSRAARRRIRYQSSAVTFFRAPMPKQSARFQVSSLRFLPCHAVAAQRGGGSVTRYPLHFTFNLPTFHLSSCHPLLP